MNNTATIQPRSSVTDSMEDLLSEHNCFVNGFTNKPSHSDSYMTVLDFIALNKAWEIIKNNYTKEQWLSACGYWKSQNYLSPILGLLGMTIERKFE